MCSVLFVQLSQHGLIGSFREFALLINQGHNVQLFDCNQIQSILVVYKFNVLPVDSFQIVFFLFQLEDVTHKKLLQVFIGVINAKLLETVVVEVLKTENVQNTNGAALPFLRSVDSCVDFFDDEHEQTTVNSFNESVTYIYALFSGQCGHYSLSMSEQSLAS